MVVVGFKYRVDYIVLKCFNLLLVYGFKKFKGVKFILIKNCGVSLV